MWESHDPNAGWDGRYNGALVQSGVYTWKIDLVTALIEERQVYTGHVTVLR